MLYMCGCVVCLSLKYGRNTIFERCQYMHINKYHKWLEKKSLVFTSVSSIEKNRNATYTDCLRADKSQNGGITKRVAEICIFNLHVISYRKSLKMFRSGDPAIAHS